MNNAKFAVILMLLIVLVVVAISIDMKLGKLVLLAEEGDSSSTVSINGSHNIIGSSNTVLKPDGHG